MKNTKIKKKIMKPKLVLTLFTLVLSYNVFAHEIDTIPTSKGNLLIHFLGHGSLMFEYGGKVIHIDPFSKVADYTKLPKADLILITHQHGDHLDSMALANCYKSGTSLYWTLECNKNSKYKIASAKILVNGDRIIWKGILIDAVPAYNIINKRDNGVPYHPAGEGNGYIITIGGKRIYVAGDTENIPEMLRFRPIDIAFIPMNLPYTMTPEMAKDAVLMIGPKIVYPYHYGETDTSILVNLLRDTPNIDVRIRKME